VARSTRVSETVLAMMFRQILSTYNIISLDIVHIGYGFSSICGRIRIKGTVSRDGS
jgi:hypothetical protein